MEDTTNPPTLKAENISHISGVIGAILGSGSAFLHMDKGQQAFIPSHLMRGLGIGVGDAVRCWATPNDSEHWQRVQYRAIRIDRVRTLSGEEIVVPADQAPAPRTDMGMAVAPVAVAREAQADPVVPVPAPARAMHAMDVTPLILDAMREPRAFTVKDLHRRICTLHPDQWQNDLLIGSVVSAATSLSAAGQIVTVRLYSSTEQTKASAVYYAKSVELLDALLRNPT